MGLTHSIHSNRYLWFNQISFHFLQQIVRTGCLGAVNIYTSRITCHSWHISVAEWARKWLTFCGRERYCDQFVWHSIFRRFSIQRHRNREVSNCTNGKWNANRTIPMAMRLVTCHRCFSLSPCVQFYILCTIESNCTCQCIRISMRLSQQSWLFSLFKSIAHVFCMYKKLCVLVFIIESTDVFFTIALWIAFFNFSSYIVVHHLLVQLMWIERNDEESSLLEDSLQTVM